MSADYITAVGYGAEAKVAEGVITDDFTENDLDTAIYELGLKRVEIVSFGDYRVHGTLDMELAVVLSNTLSTYESFEVNDIYYNEEFEPIYTEQIVAELNKLREYLDFGEVETFDWVTGSYIC